MKTKKEEVLEDIKSKKFTVYFYLPDDGGQIMVSQGEILSQAFILSENGYDVKILVDDSSNKDFGIPFWVDEKYKNLKTILMSKIKEYDVNISIKDFMVIPELFVHFFHNIKGLPCKKIMLVQSIDSLMRGISNPSLRFIRDFDVDTFIVTTDVAESFLMENYAIESQYFEVHKKSPKIPKYFYDNRFKMKMPKIAIYGKNTNEIKNLVNIFMSRYPMFSWLSFEGIGGLKREEFAERLSEYCCAIWSDVNGTFGTFPLECLAAGVLCVGKKPNYVSDHLFYDGVFIFEDYFLPKNENGNHNDLVEGVYKIVAEFLENQHITITEDGVLKGLDEAMHEQSKKHMETEESKKETLGVYEKIFQNRYLQIENLK